MTTENPILDQARANIQKRETDRFQQGEADRICGDIRLICEALLEQYGSPRRSAHDRLGGNSSVCYCHRSTLDGYKRVHSSEISYISIPYMGD